MLVLYQPLLITIVRDDMRDRFIIIMAFVAAGMLGILLANAQLVNKENKDALASYNITPHTISHVQEDGKVRLTIHSSPKFVEEDAKWKKIEDARSLKDKMIDGKPIFELRYLKEDPRYDFEVIDFNYTHVEFKAVLKDKKLEGKNVPFKVWTKDEPIMEYQPMSFSSTSEKKTIIHTSDNIFKQNFTIGENSTTVYFGVSEISIDGRVRDGSVPVRYYGQLKWDISSIPAAATIDNATMCGWLYDGSGAPENTITVFRVDDQAWGSGADTSYVDAQTLDTESDITMNSTANGAYTCFAIHNIIQADVNDGNDYSTVRWEYQSYPLGTVNDVRWDAEDEFGVTGSYQALNSAEDSAANGMTPLLDLTYTAAGGGGNPSPEVYLYINDTSSVDSDYIGTFGDSFNITANVNFTDMPVTIYVNGTARGNGTGVAFNHTTTDWFGNATYNISAGWVGNTTIDGNSTEMILYVHKATSGFVYLQNGSGCCVGSSYPEVFNYTIDADADNQQGGNKDCSYGVRYDGTNMSHSVGDSMEISFRLAGGNWNTTGYIDSCANYTNSQQDSTTFISPSSGYEVYNIINGVENEDAVLINNSIVNITCMANGTIVLDNYEPFTLEINLSGWESVIGDNPYENVTTMYTATAGSGHRARCEWIAADGQNYTTGGAIQDQYFNFTDGTINDEEWQSSVLEEDIVDFYLNMTAPIGANAVTSAVLSWNDTNYTYDSIANYTRGEAHRLTIGLNKTLTIPEIGLYNENVTFNWTIRFSLNNGNVYDYSSSNHDQSIWRPLVGACNSTLTKVKELVFYNETSDFSPINATINAYINLSTGEEYNFTANNFTVDVCMYPSWINTTADIQFEYTNTSGYRIRQYYIDDGIIDNVSEILDLYLIPTSISSALELSAQDQFGNPLDNMIIEVDRWYPELRSYKTVAAPKTDVAGRTLTYVLLNDVNYRFRLTQGGTTIQIFDQRLITDTSLELTVNPTTLVDWLEYWDKITGSCSYSEDTGYISCTYSETSGLASYIQLKAYRRGALSKVEICSQTNDTFPSGSFQCSVGNVSSDVLDIKMTAKLTTGSADEYMFWSELLEIGAGISRMFGSCNSVSNLGKCQDGLFMTFILTMTAAFVGVHNPSVSIAMMLGGFSVSVLAGLYAISLASLIGTILVGMIIIYRMRA